jgi:preprotein translocase subunit YajC
MNLNDPFLTTMLPMLALFGIFYFLLIRPQQQRLKAHQEMVKAVRRGDTVVTAGGLIGKVAKVKDDAEIMVEIADNVQVRVLKSTLTEVRSKGEPKGEKGEA